MKNVLYPKPSANLTNAGRGTLETAAPKGGTMTEKHPGGRPSKYTPELLENCRKYVYGGWEECGDLIPSIAGLACELQVSRETLHQWAKDEKKPEFSDMYKDLLSFQERKLISGGLSGDFSSAITKMVMYKHGYSEKVEQDHTSSDGTMTPTVIERVIVKPDASE